ncbi:MAG TPA: hypothetical protein VK541_04620 [Pedobacter sp.]|nr:hypothetical protein [Pedobacter sp.]
MNINCCEASGPRGLFNFPAYVVMKSKEGLFVNYYVQGRYQLTTPSGKPVTVKQQTTYPEGGTIKLILSLNKDEDFVLSLRIPAWSKKNAVTVNGAPVEGIKAGAYAAVSRKWKNGDMVEITLDMRGRVAYAGDQPKYAAISRGPILLARDESLPGISMGAFVDVKGNDGYIDLIPVAHDVKDNWMQFRFKFAPESYTEAGGAPVTIDLCDYASAGNGPKAGSFISWLPQITDPRKVNQ